MEKAGFVHQYLFDSRVEGVTTISCDPHKYVSSALHSQRTAMPLSDRSCAVFCCVVSTASPPREPPPHVPLGRAPPQYSFATQWSGGIYATPTILGSRPGGVVAATWAAMKHGEEGYIETTKQIVGATRKIGEAIRCQASN